MRAPRLRPKRRQARPQRTRRAQKPLRGAPDRNPLSGAWSRNVPIGHKIETQPLISLAGSDNMRAVGLDDLPRRIRIQIGKERVRRANAMVFRNHRLRAPRQELAIDRSPTHDPGNLVGREQRERLANGPGNLDPLRCKGKVTREHDITPVLKRPTPGKTQKGFAPHDDGMPLRAPHKVLHICPVCNNHVTGKPNPPVIANSHNGLQVRHNLSHVTASP